MEWYDLVNISERYMELVNPSSPEKVIKIGQILRLNEATRVLDMGCGFAEPLTLWTERFGSSGIGVEVREEACQRAISKVAERNLAERIKIVCENGRSYAFEKASFDVAMCLGATFIWNGYRQTIQTMREAIKPGGRLVIGEPFWSTDQIPPEYAQAQPYQTEVELLNIAQQEGFDIEYRLISSMEDWDRYASDNWYGLIRWIEENPSHPERQQVIDYLHDKQQDYLTMQRKYMGWAIFVLAPMTYVRK